MLNDAQGCNKCGLLECEHILHEIELLVFYDNLYVRLDRNNKRGSNHIQIEYGCIMECWVGY